METVTRVISTGNVDDGKSTLLGGLLLELGAVPLDVVEKLRAWHPEARTPSGTDPSKLFDGLRDEVAQQVTIDVGYRTWHQGGRRFLLADCPGHEERIGAFATAASFADVALLIADASRPIAPPTRRFLRLCCLFGTRAALVCVNKMDAVGYDRSAYGRVVEALAGLAPSARFLPVSGLLGDNVAHRSPRIPWYDGPTVVEALSAPAPAASFEAEPLVLSVAPGPVEGDGTVLIQVESGLLHAGEGLVDETGRERTLSELTSLGQSVALLKRGESGAGFAPVDRPGLWFRPGEARPVSHSADVLWLSPTPARTGASYRVRHLNCERTTRLVSLEKGEPLFDRGGEGLTNGEFARVSFDPPLPVRGPGRLGGTLWIDERGQTAAIGVLR